MISSKRNILLAYLALLLASALFLFRGLLRASTDYVNDFGAPYVSTRLWLEHKNPYDPSLFYPTWHAAGAPEDATGNPSNTHPVYPPPTLVAVLPFAILPWPTAVHALTVLSVIAYGAALWQLSTLLPGTWLEPRKPLFLAAGLAFAPAQSSLHVANVACLAASLVFLAATRLLRQTRDPDLPAALYIAVAISLKAALGLIILPWLLFRARRTLAVTLAASALIAGISLYPLLHTGNAWLTSLKENLAYISANGGVCDLSALNPSRFDRIDLQPPLYALTHSRSAASLSAAFIAAVLFFLWLIPSIKNRASREIDASLLSLATLLAIGLLPVYQRYYVAIVFIPAILWAFRNLSASATRWALGLCAIFFVNTEALFRSTLYATLNHHLPRLTEAVLGPHLCWLVLLLTCILLHTFAGTSQEWSSETTSTDVLLPAPQPSNPHP